MPSSEGDDEPPRKQQMLQELFTSDPNELIDSGPVELVEESRFCYDGPKWCSKRDGEGSMKDEAVRKFGEWEADETSIKSLSDKNESESRDIYKTCQMLKPGISIIICGGSESCRQLLTEKLAELMHGQQCCMKCNFYCRNQRIQENHGSNKVEDTSQPFLEDVADNKYSYDEDHHDTSVKETFLSRTEESIDRPSMQSWSIRERKMNMDNENSKLKASKYAKLQEMQRQQAGDFYHQGVKSGFEYEKDENQETCKHLKDAIENEKSDENEKEDKATLTSGTSSWFKENKEIDNSMTVYSKSSEGTDNFEKEDDSKLVKADCREKKEKHEYEKTEKCLENTEKCHEGLADTDAEYDEIEMAEVFLGDPVSPDSLLENSISEPISGCAFKSTMSFKKMESWSYSLENSLEDYEMSQPRSFELNRLSVEWKYPRHGCYRGNIIISDFSNGFLDEVAGYGSIPYQAYALPRCDSKIINTFLSLCSVQDRNFCKESFTKKCESKGVVDMIVDKDSSYLMSEMSSAQGCLTYSSCSYPFMYDCADEVLCSTKEITSWSIHSAADPKVKKNDYATGFTEFTSDQESGIWSSSVDRLERSCFSSLIQSCDDEGDPQNEKEEQQSGMQGNEERESKWMMMSGKEHYSEDEEDGGMDLASLKDDYEDREDNSCDPQEWRQAPVEIEELLYCKDKWKLTEQEKQDDQDDMLTVSQPDQEENKRHTCHRKNRKGKDLEDSYSKALSKGKTSKARNSRRITNRKQDDNKKRDRRCEHGQRASAPQNRAQNKAASGRQLRRPCISMKKQRGKRRRPRILIPQKHAQIDDRNTKIRQNLYKIKGLQRGFSSSHHGDPPIKLTSVKAKVRHRSGGEAGSRGRSTSHNSSGGSAGGSQGSGEKASNSSGKNNGQSGDGDGSGKRNGQGNNSDRNSNNNVNNNLNNSKTDKSSVKNKMISVKNPKESKSNTEGNHIHNASSLRSEGHTPNISPKGTPEPARHVFSVAGRNQPPDKNKQNSTQQWEQAPLFSSSRIFEPSLPTPVLDNATIAARLQAEEYLNEDRPVTPDSTYLTPPSTTPEPSYVTPESPYAGESEGAQAAGGGHGAKQRPTQPVTVGDEEGNPYLPHSVMSLEQLCDILGSATNGLPSNLEVFGLLNECLTHIMHDLTVCAADENTGSSSAVNCWVCLILSQLLSHHASDTGFGLLCEQCCQIFNIMIQHAITCIRANRPKSRLSRSDLCYKICKASDWKVDKLSATLDRLVGKVRKYCAKVLGSLPETLRNERPEDGTGQSMGEIGALPSPEIPSTGTSKTSGHSLSLNGNIVTTETGESETSPSEEIPTLPMFSQASYVPSAAVSSTITRTMAMMPPISSGGGAVGTSGDEAASHMKLVRKSSVRRPPVIPPPIVEENHIIEHSASAVSLIGARGNEEKELEAIIHKRYGDDPYDTQPTYGEHNRYGSMPLGSAVHDEEQFMSVWTRPRGVPGVGEVVFGYQSQLRKIAAFWDKKREDCERTQTCPYMHREEGVILAEQKEHFSILRTRYQKHHQWERVTHLGNGMSGKCHLAIDLKTNFKFCCKKIHLLRYSEEELSLWSEMHNPYIVRLYGAIRHGVKVYIFSEFLDGGSLAACIEEQKRLGRRLSHWSAINYFQQLLKALAYLQSKNILHEDIKADNIVLRRNSTHLALTDFGASRRLQDPKELKNKSPLGSPTHWSPEKASMEGHGFPSDVWAAVCVLVHMLSGEPPWVKRFLQRAAILNFIIYAKPPPMEDVPDNVQAVVRNLIERGFVKEPQHRPSASELLQHSAFSILDQGTPENYFSTLMSQAHAIVPAVQSAVGSSEQQTPRSEGAAANVPQQSAVLYETTVSVGPYQESDHRVDFKENKISQTQAVGDNKQQEVQVESPVDNDQDGSKGDVEEAEEKRDKPIHNDKQKDAADDVAGSSTVTPAVITPNQAGGSSAAPLTITTPNQAGGSSAAAPTITTPNQAGGSSAATLTKTTPNQAGGSSAATLTITTPNQAGGSSAAALTITTPNQAGGSSAAPLTITTPNQAGGSPTNLSGSVKFKANELTGPVDINTLLPVFDELFASGDSINNQSIKSFFADNYSQPVNLSDATQIPLQVYKPEEKSGEPLPNLSIFNSSWGTASHTNREPQEGGLSAVFPLIPLEEHVPLGACADASAESRNPPLRNFKESTLRKFKESTSPSKNPLSHLSSGSDDCNSGDIFGSGPSEALEGSGQASSQQIWGKGSYDDGTEYRRTSSSTTPLSPGDLSPVPSTGSNHSSSGMTSLQQRKPTNLKLNVAPLPHSRSETHAGLMAIGTGLDETKRSSTWSAISHAPLTYQNSSTPKSGNTPSTGRLSTSTPRKISNTSVPSTASSAHSPFMYLSRPNSVKEEQDRYYQELTGDMLTALSISSSGSEKLSDLMEIQTEDVSPAPEEQADSDGRSATAALQEEIGELQLVGQRFRFHQGEREPLVIRIQETPVHWRPLVRRVRQWLHGRHFTILNMDDSPVNSDRLVTAHEFKVQVLEKIGPDCWCEKCHPRY